MPSSSSLSQQRALYTKFCIGVELGDDSLVRDMVTRGQADTMVSYGVDGNITTPMQSALKKGNIPMALALLTSRSTRVRLADIDSAPKIKKDLITPVLLSKVGNALEPGARELLFQREPQPAVSSRVVKVSLSSTLGEYLRKEDPKEHQQYASPTDRPRCPPGDASLSSSSSDDEEGALTPTDSGDEEDVQMSSIASSAGDSSGGDEE